MTTVLFVCVENSCRSQMAEAFARIYGRGKLDAYSAGSHPSGQVNPKAIEAMAEIGYNLAPHRSKSLAELPVHNFDYVITMGCGDQCASVAARHREDWNIPDPKELGPAEFRQVRDLIARQVQNLIASITTR